MSLLKCSRRLPDAVRSESTPDLAGPEHHVQPILTHDRVLSLESPRTLAVADNQASTLCYPTLRWFQKTSNKFLE